MRAALLHKPKPVEFDPLCIEDVDIPRPKHGQVLIKIEACGVCRSNLHMIEGEWVKFGLPAKLPIVPGHEIVGRVYELGEGVEDIKIGQRVGVQPLWSSCGYCSYCLKGQEHLCRKKEITGETVDGGYAEFMLANAMHIYPLPEDMDPVSTAPLFCPGITAYGAVMKADIKPGKKVAVFGIGGVGHIVIQLAKLYGAEVVAISRNDKHLEIAEKLGADYIVNSLRENVVEVISSIGGVDASIVFAPSDEAVEQAIRSTKPSGTIVVGVLANIGAFPFYEEKKIVGSVIGSRSMMFDVIELAKKGKIKTICESYKLDYVNEVLKRLKRSEVVQRAVLIP